MRFSLIAAEVKGFLDQAAVIKGNAGLELPCAVAASIKGKICLNVGSGVDFKPSEVFQRRRAEVSQSPREFVEISS